MTANSFRELWAEGFGCVGLTGCDRYIAQGVLAPVEAPFVRKGRSRVVSRFICPCVFLMEDAVFVCFHGKAM